MPYIGGNLSAGGVQWSLVNENKNTIQDWYRASYSQTYKNLSKPNYIQPNVLGNQEEGVTARDRYFQNRQLDGLRPPPPVSVPIQEYRINRTAGTAGDISGTMSMAGIDVLPISMIDMDQLEDRMNREYMRNSPNNPLSAAYAMQAAIEDDVFNPQRLNRSVHQLSNRLTQQWEDQETEKYRTAANKRIADKYAFSKNKPNYTTRETQTYSA